MTPLGVHLVARHWGSIRAQFDVDGDSPRSSSSMTPKFVWLILRPDVKPHLKHCSTSALFLSNFLGRSFSLTPFRGSFC